MNFSFIILTYNEEVHLRRLLDSIYNLSSDIFILDSGSQDKTVQIANSYNAVVKFHEFENHPKQWQYALHCFEIKTPWLICLDADHIVTSSLYKILETFNLQEIPSNIDGIYFNRHNYFKGKRLLHGGYRNKYLLKMFRTGIGYSDINENMDHRFIVPGDTLIWKKGIIIEENLKENDIRFWIDKHNRYSDLVAEEEIERLSKSRLQSIKPKAFGNPDERIALLKSFWWRMPLYVRPFLYFFYRFFIQAGILDSGSGRMFHFLQAFWFRLIVDIKIKELKSKKK